MIDQHGNKHWVSNMGEHQNIDYITDGWLNTDGSIIDLGGGKFVDTFSGQSPIFSPEFGNPYSTLSMSGKGMLPKTPKMNKMAGKGMSPLDLASNINNAAGGATSVVAGQYYFGAKAQVYKYAQVMNGKVRSAATISRWSTLHSLRVANTLAKVSVAGSALGMLGSVYNISSDFNSNGNGIRDTRLIDWIDLGVGAVGVGAFLMSNPVGWAVGMGVGIYFASRAIYELSQ